MSKQLDMSASTLTSYERGERTPSVEFLTRLYRILNVNTNWFVSGDGEMFINKNIQISNFHEEIEQVVINLLIRKGIIRE